jgi:hypothetical protein
MTYLVRPADLTGPVAAHRPKTATIERPGILRRIYNAIMEAQERKANRDIERVVAARAGFFNDSLEREIGEHMSSGNMMTRR